MRERQKLKKSGCPEEKCRYLSVGYVYVTLRERTEHGVPRRLGRYRMPAGRIGDRGTGRGGGGGGEKGGTPYSNVHRLSIMKVVVVVVTATMMT